MSASVTLQDTINFASCFVDFQALAVGNANEPAMSSGKLALQTILGPPFAWPWNRAKATFLTTPGQQDYNVSPPNFGFLETASIQMAMTINFLQVFSNVATYAGSLNNFTSLSSNPSANGLPVTITGCATSAYNGTFPLISAGSFGPEGLLTVAIDTPDNVEDESGALAVAGPIMPLDVKWGATTEAVEQDRPTFISTQSSDESGVNFTFRLLPVPDTTYRVNLTYQQAPTAFTGQATPGGFRISFSTSTPTSSCS